MKKKSKTINVSIIIFVVLVLSFCAIIAKLSYVALAKKVDGMNLTEFVKNRNTETVTLKAQRGSIYSIDGELLAKNVNAYTVIAYLSSTRTKDIDNPKHVVDKDRTAEELAKVLGGDKEYYLQRLNANAYQVEFGVHGKGITELVKKQIEALDLPGIDFIPTSKRTYQMGSFASYIIGFASEDDDGAITGKMGIEAYYDNELQGKDGYTIYQKDAMGYTIPNTTPITVDAESGKDVYLTIDSKIQMFVENGIADVSKDNKMTWLTFTVMDAKTGAIVASASNPTFNLNTRQADNYLNPLTQYSYEPGSTMKIFSFMAAMENGIYNGKDTYASGTIQVDDARIKDFNGVGWGTITFDSGFAYSSNVAATNLALKLGREKLYNFYSDIGFGKKTGITLPGELNGSINFIYKSELATASFGQGIVTTPVQQLQALSILTNEGIELQPYIVDRIVDSETGEVIYKHERTELGRKASKETTDKLLSLMYDVVYSGKTDAKFYQTDSVKLVGKTGTAEFVGDNGQYLTGDYNYVRSFAGVFPYDDPQYIIYVSVKQYQGSYRDFAKMVSGVVEEIAKYKNITEKIDKVDSTKIVEMDNYISVNVNEAIEKLNLQRLIVICMGNGKYVVKQYPPKGKTLLIGNKVFLVTESEEYIMPDVIGWSSNELITLCKLLNIKYTVNGYGKVIGTNIETGATINRDTVIEINLG
jgi:penicillin-binding protein 2B